MTHDRLINPMRQPDRHIERELGVRTGGQLGREIDRTKRFPGGGSRVLKTRQIVWHRAGIGASGDAAYLMRLAVPSSDSAWAMVNLQWPAPGAGRIIGFELWSSEARTGGTASARVRITTNGSAVDYTFEDCQLNATTTLITTHDLLWRSGLDVAKDATIEGRILTASTWGPTSADVTLVVIYAMLDDV